MTKFLGRPLTKRQFLTQTTAAIGITAGSFYLRPAYAAETYDMIIIGGGTAGIPCAINAADKGAKVLIVEKSYQIGGTLWLAGGSMAAAGTRVQASKEIKDTPDMHYANIMDLARNKADPAIIRRFVENAGPMANWLQDEGFVVRDGEPVAGRGGHAAFTTARYFQGKERGRSILKTLLPLLAKHVASGQVKVLLSTGAAELVVGKDRSVQGIVAVTEDGRRTQYTGRKVVIASGGYCSSPSVFKKVTGHTLYSSASYFMSQGEGLALGESAGGFVRNGENQVLNPSVVNDHNYPSVSIGSVNGDPLRRMPWEISVNTHSERYFAEDVPDVDIRDATFSQQPDGRLWTIFDQNIRDQAPPVMPSKSTAEMDLFFSSHMMFSKAQSLEELAKHAGLDGAKLRQTIEEYNAGVRNKTDRFGRKFLPAEIATPPFYAIEQHGSNIVGFGGLTVNAYMQVLRRDGSVIQNLYAAGEVIGHGATNGTSMVGGMAVTPALTFGRLIGLDAMNRA